jgi:predicted dehydrogenase
MNRPIRTAVVGCGYWGPNLIRNLASLSGSDLKVVCDLDEARLAHLKGLYPMVQTETDYQHVVRSDAIDAVVVATPVHLHFPVAKASLEAGKHTFIEKPMASSAAECSELVSLAAQKKLTLMVGHTFLYSAPVRRIKEIVDAGEIGEILYISSRRLNLGLFQKDINVMWDLAPHDLSIILYLMGEQPCSINCQGNANVTEGIEDVTNMTLTFAGGGFATIHSSWLDPKKVRDMAIVGTQKMIHYDDLEPLQKIRIYDQHVRVPPHYDTYAEFQYAYHYGDMWAPRVEQAEPLKVECQHFIDCICTGDKPITHGEHGLELIQILEAASESLRRDGARVEIRTQALEGKGSDQS